MANTYFRLTDADFSIFLQNFKTVADTNPLNYGWTPAQVAQIESLATAYQDSLAEATKQEAEYRAAVQAKDDARASAENMVSQFGQPLYYNPAVTDADIAALGLEPRAGTRAPVVPQTPINFTATPFEDGRVNFRWGRNGNGYTISFAIEAAPLGTSNWTEVLNTTRSRATGFNFTPGVATMFRVRAFKGEDVSPWSGVVAIYSGGDSVSLKAA